MKKFLLILTVLGMTAVAMSCTSFQTTGVEVSLTGTQSDVLGNFETSLWVNKFLGVAAGPTLFNLTSTATDDVVANLVKDEIAKKGGDRAINVKIEYKASFLQLLANSITGSIWAPSQVVVTGTVVKDRTN